MMPSGNAAITDKLCSWLRLLPVRMSAAGNKIKTTDQKARRLFLGSLPSSRRCE